MARTWEGGCSCGGTRYRASGEAFDVGFCHCQSCRRATGAPFVAWATFEKRHFALTRGDLARHPSSEHVLRGFCASCGTPLTYEHLARPDAIDVTLASLDDPGALRPQFHIWVSHKLPWVVLEDGLPQHSEWRPGRAISSVPG